MLNINMPSFNFDFIESYLLQIPKYCWEYLTSSSSLGYSAEIEFLRARYYLNATFLEKMAKMYGELNFFIKLLLLGVSVSIGTLCIFNPWFFLLGASLLLIIDFLSIQFDAMEQRFKLMIEDIAALEKKLDKKIQENSEIKQKLESSLEKNSLLVAQLKESGEEIAQIKAEIIAKRVRISNACDIIEGSAQKVSEATSNYVEKTQHIIDSFSATPVDVEECIALSKEAVKKSEEALSNSREASKESALVDDYISRFMKEHGIVFDYPDTSDTQERSRSHGFFQGLNSPESADSVSGLEIV